MVRIRLRRVGAKGQPSYRIVVTDSRSPRDGRYIEMLGFYNPRTSPETVRIDEARVLYWLDKGAQPSEAVYRMLNRLGVIGRFQRLRAGESLEVLLAEARAEQAARQTVDPRTRRDGGDAVPQKAKAKEKAAKEPGAEPEAVLGGEETTEAEA